MKRRQRKKIVAISLLPFLSILACLIGVLSVMITGISFGQMEETQDVNVVSDSNEYNKIRSDIVALTKQIENVQNKIDTAKQKEKQKDSSVVNLNKLTHELEKIKVITVNGSRRRLQLNQDIQLQKTVLEELTQEYEEVKKTVSAKKTEIAFRKNPVNHPVIKIEKINGGSIKVPYFVECIEGQLNYLENNKIKTVFKAPLLSNKEFHDFLSKVRKVPLAGVVFLIRSSGSEIYREAKKIAIHFSCRSGKLPLQGIGLVDTSVYKITLPKDSKQKVLSKKKIPKVLKKTPVKLSGKSDTPKKVKTPQGNVIPKEAKTAGQEKKDLPKKKNEPQKVVK